MNRPIHYLDTNVIIAIVEGAESLTENQWAFLNAIERGAALALTSEITLAECLVKPYATRSEAALTAYLSFLGGRREFPVVAISRDILLRAAQWRAETRMPLPDAVHVATAQTCGCSLFISEDRRVKSDESMRLLTWTGFEFVQ